MPFVLLFIGLLLVVVAVRDNQDAFFAQLGKDFFGPGSFTVWIVAIVVLGSLGYVKAIKTPVNLLLGLMLAAFFIANRGGFANALPALQAAFEKAGIAPPNAGTSVSPSTTVPASPLAPDLSSISGVKLGGGLASPLDFLTKIANDPGGTSGYYAKDQYGNVGAVDASGNAFGFPF